MNMTYNIVPISPLTKETLKRYKNDMEAQLRMNIMKGYVQKIYGDIIRTATNGYTNYIFTLSEKRYLDEKKYIIELITELYLIFPDSLIQYTEKNLCDIPDYNTITPCIIIDWM